jgi:alpha-L-fucosidase
MTIRFRQIHMDFHTSPEIPDVGADFDGAEFAQTLKQANVDSVTCFAKCHHGMSYYPTEVGVVHPHLKRDLLGEQIEACHRAGINVPVYISVVWDEHAAAAHADWLQVSPSGALAGRPPFGNHGWRFLCMNSPYLDYVL